MSAPPGKFNLASLTKSLKTHQGPDSPRLSQVVEKSESLSWKIEYQQESDQESTSASPLLQRRKQTPPMMMSRSLGKLFTYTKSLHYTKFNYTNFDEKNWLHLN